ncbi:hypothetical protein ACFL2Q_01435 [Thermodesulfobacteriota bacterium]
MVRKTRQDNGLQKELERREGILDQAEEELLSLCEEALRMIDKAL